MTKCRLSVVLLAAAIACSKGSAPAETACQVLSDCPSKHACINHACVPLCSSQADCTGGTVCEDAICQSPACGADSECSGGNACLNGKCAAAPTAADVASCDVSPNPAVVHAGSTVQLVAVPKDSSGKALHFTNITWAATGAGSVNATTGVVTGNGAGVVNVTATAGSKTCTASVTSYAAAAANTLRVTVINIHTKEPVAGAKVMIDSAVSTTGSDGTTSASVSAGAHDVHVFASGYGYTSFIQTTGTDLLVPLSPYIKDNMRSGFTAHMCESRTDASGNVTDPKCAPESEFAPMSLPGEGIHLAFFGSGVPNSLLDLSVSTLVGPLHQVSLSLTGGSPTNVNLPYGLVLGLTSNFFGTADYRVFADGGERALWGIGGNLKVSQVAAILNPILAGGTSNIDIGTLLPQILPFFSSLQAGAVVGVKAPANATLNTQPTFANQTIPLNTPLRLKATAVSPSLPTIDGNYVDGVIAVAGAADYPLGFIPLGLTAGLSHKDAGGHNTGTVDDPVCLAAGDSNCTTGRLPMRIASLNNGAEGSKMSVALLALNFGGLTPGSTTRVALSGQIKTIDPLTYAAPPSNGPDLNYDPFLALPATASVTVTKSNRTAAIAGDADANVQIYRLELENNARLNWNIWLPKTGSGTRNVVLPDPSQVDPSFVDPFLDIADANGTVAGPTARLLGMQFTTSTTADAVESFGNVTLDNIGAGLKAFTALQVPVSQ